MGLKGNSGLIYDDNGKLVMHLNMPYDAGKNKVFAIIQDPEQTELPTWERMTAKQADKRNLPIITCCQCDKPATQLDHHWPYMSGMCLCDDHKYNPEECE